MYSKIEFDANDFINDSTLDLIRQLLDVDSDVDRSIAGTEKFEMDVNDSEIDTEIDINLHDPTLNDILTLLGDD